MTSRVWEPRGWLLGSVLLWLLTGPGLAQTDLLTHGPLTGHLSDTGVRVWGRTAGPHRLAVRYGLTPGLAGALTSEAVTTSADHDFTAAVELRGLAPNTKYYFELVVDAQPVDTRVDGQRNSFTTLPNRAQFVDPRFNPRGDFNFSFEVATGNNQRGGAWETPTLRTIRQKHKDQIHFWIPNGDWLYEELRETTPAQWATANQQAAPPILDLSPGTAGVWENYKLYLHRSQHLSDLHREVPFFATFDDHEILNDVFGSGQVGLRADGTAADNQGDPFRYSPSGYVERAVFRDPALRAWQDYLGWANPTTGAEQPLWFGRAQIKAGSGRLHDAQADFRKLDLAKSSTLHVHWGQRNSGVYEVVRVIDPQTIEVRPAPTADETVRYSIGTNHYSKVRIGNVEIYLLDARTHRTLHDPANPTDPRTTMLGAKQLAWLRDSLRTSDAQFFFLVSSVNFVVPHDNGAWLGRGQSVTADNKDDGWTAMVHEREVVIADLLALQRPAFILTGDLHKSFVAEIGPGVFEFASGPRTSGNHRLVDAGGAPPSGWFDSKGRLVKIKWATGWVADRPRGSVYPTYAVIRVQNAFNSPRADGSPRWVAYPEPFVTIEYRDGLNGEVQYAESVSTADARRSRQPVPLERVRELGGTDLVGATPR